MTVGQSDVHFLGSLNDSESFGSGDVLGDFSAENSVVHEEAVHVLFASDQELLEASGQLVSGLVVLLATDLHLLGSSSESSSGSAIDTSDSPV